MTSTITEEMVWISKLLSQSITDHKEPEEQIREQAAFLDRVCDVVTVLDIEHRIIYWKSCAERLYGWKPAEAIGSNVNELLYKDISPCLLMSKLVVNTGITEKKKLEIQLPRVQRMESTGMLAGGIVHDLNNLLAPVMLSIQMLKEKRPDLILLGLNLPKRNGKEVLADINNDTDLERISVVILTISSPEQDILTCYNHHANCCIIKPVDLDRFIEVIKSIVYFWLSAAKLSPGE